jgi:minor extracellular serine protease Vpr
MKLLIPFFMLLSSYLQLAAQAPAAQTKIGATLKLLLAQQKPASPLITMVNGTEHIPVIIEYNPLAAAPETSMPALQVRTRMGTIATADIALRDVALLAALPHISRVELPLLLRKTDTVMKKFTRTYYVHNQTAPLDSAYTGRNTLLGVIDDGIDFSHPDFLDAQHKTRVMAIWNMDHPGTAPTGFGYGHEWLPDTLEYYAQRYRNKTITNTQLENLFGYSFHGTSVTGLAAGNNGVAPNAAIAVVSLVAYGDTLLRSDRMLDAIQYLYQKAKAANKKCVINISLGIMDGGPHDGKTLVEKAMDNFCEEKPDVLISCSAGNNGNTWKHWGGFPVHQDSSYTFFNYSYGGNLYYTVPRQYSKQLSLSFAESAMGSYNQPNISTDSIIGQSIYVNIDSAVNSTYPIRRVIKDSTGKLYTELLFSAAHYNDLYDEVVVKLTSLQTNGGNLPDARLMRMIWKGSGSFHCWFPFFNVHPQFYFNQNPLPADSTFSLTDNDYTTVIPSHAFSVISSGAYNIRSCFVHIDKEVVSQYDKCRTTYFTSHGPTMDGRIKPDILNPGDNVMAPRKRFDDFFEHQFIVDTNTVSFGGTSAASPITAGMAALIWEKYPHFTRQQVINLIKSTADFDSHCQQWGPQPNNITGMGKADILMALTGQRLAVDTLCSAYDVCRLTHDPAEPPVQPIPDFFSIFPNPANGYFYINYKYPQPLSYRLFNSQGQLVYSGRLFPTGNTMLTMQVTTARLPAGVYSLHLSNNKTILAKKVLVQHH